MSAKTTTSQPPGRRTPLSLNASIKQHTNKPTNDNPRKDNNTNNQKTDTSKKDFQPERKTSADKKPSSTDTRKPSSHDSKKQEEFKKNDDNKKNQNGVNSSNGVKDKEKQANNGGGSANKPKPETSSGGVSTPKKESQKSIEKKKETTTEAVAKDVKIDDNKSNKEKTKEDGTKKDDGKKKEKDYKEEVKDTAEKKKTVEKTSEATSEKPSEPKVTVAKGLENPKVAEKELMELMELESLPEQIIAESAVKEKEQPNMIRNPIKEIAESPNQEEKPVQHNIDGELEDVEMEPLVYEVKRSPKISAASTPAKSSIYSEGLPKASPKSETKPPKPPLTQSPDRKSCPRTFSSISGRRTIRPIGDYTFSGNLHIRESYRKINTELDFTTSSMNVTVGSEVPNNDSFSFFSRSRKRDRSSPTHQSTIELQGDISPKSPKRPRIETGMAGFFNAMASPITMLRARLSRATVQSTPKKLVEISIEDDIVENVSGISVEEEITATEDLNVNPDSTVEILMPEDDNPKEEPATCSAKPPIDVKSDDDIKIKETLTNADMQAKKKCIIM